MATEARQEYYRLRREIRELLDAAKTLPDLPIPPQRMASQELHLRLTIVALIGSLQGYLSDLLEEKCDSLPSIWEGLNRVQQRYVAMHMKSNTQQLLTEFTEQDLSDAKKIDKFTKRLHVQAMARTDPDAYMRSANRKDFEGFLGDNGSEALNRAVSLHHPHEIRFKDWLAKKPLYRDMLSRLDQIIVLRNDAAHGRFNHRVTFRQAREYRVIVDRLVDKVDEYVQTGTQSPAHSLKAMGASPAATQHGLATTSSERTAIRKLSAMVTTPYFRLMNIWRV